MVEPFREVAWRLQKEPTCREKRLLKKAARKRINDRLAFGAFVSG
jgi:hypothetical protein